jgi:hypothetical protein
MPGHTPGTFYIEAEIAGNCKHAQNILGVFIVFTL